MNVNPLIMDIARGEWLMSFQGLSTWAPIAHKLITGENISIEQQASALMTVFDKNGRKVMPDEDGGIKAPKGSKAFVNMVGPIVKYGDLCTYGADEIVGALSLADSNPNIDSTVLYVDGPGGSVPSIGPFLEFAKYKTKPVIGLADQCCSLHFWALNAVCDYKMADNDVSSLFGSVGVVCSFVDNKEYLEKLGYKFHDIYPDESEHKNLAFRLAMEGKYDMIKKEHLSPLAIKFQNAVRAACPNLKEVTGVLTGKTFGADLALEYGMIDGIGGMQAAFEMADVIKEIKYSK